MSISVQEVMKKKILETSDAWTTSRLSYQPREPGYSIVDCRISNVSLDGMIVVVVSYHQRNFPFPTLTSKVVQVALRGICPMPTAYCHRDYLRGI